MKQVKNCLLLCISLILLTLSFSGLQAFAQSASFQTAAVWGSNTSPLIASPGAADLPLTITVTNLGPNVVQNLTAIFVTRYPLIPISGEEQNITQYIPVLPIGSSFFLVGYFSIYSNATQGIYKETLNLSYTVNSERIIQSMNVSVPILGPPVPTQSFLASAIWGSDQSPIVASPDANNLPLQITIVNTGPSSVFDFSASFYPEQPIAPVAGEGSQQSQSVPILQPGSSVKIIGYYNILPAAQPGIYNDSILLSYSNGTRTFTQQINVQIPILGYADMHIASFNYLPSLIYPGYPEAELQVTLLNTGTSAASSVNLSLETSYPVSPLYPNANTKYIGYMPVGQPITVAFPLMIANTTLPENTTLTLLANYNHSNTSVFQIPFVEYSKAVLQASVISSSSITVGDSAAFITLSLRNTGNVAAQYATLALVPSNVFQPSIPSSASPLLAPTYLNTTIGTIAPQQQVNVTYVVSVGSNIPAGTYTINFIATWTQPGAQYPFVQEIPVQVHVAQTITQSLGQDLVKPIYLIIIVLIIVLVVVGAIAIARGRRSQ
ncbi:MAG: hypothetical protein QXT39_02550 [Conexivisphaerales archaeon]